MSSRTPSRTEAWRVMSPYTWSSNRSLSTSKPGTHQTMNLAYAAAVILLMSLPMWAGGSRKHHSSPPTPTDPDYVFALATANRFLHAWQTGDLETGMVLLSDRVRHSQDPEKFEQFFSGDANRAFEIARGLGSRGRYRFATMLVTATGSRVRRRLAEIIVVNTGKNDWVVDKLP
jgi:hypothetical protein